MKIAVNTRFLLPHQLEGIGWFTYEIFKRLVERHPEHEFVFLFDRPYVERFVFGSNVKPVVLSPPARHPILWKLWFNVSVKRYLKRTKPDVFISPDGFLPLPYSGQSISVIHDINFEHNPEYISKVARKYYLTNFKKFAREATRIATVSKYSAEDIVKMYGIDAGKIDLVYNGIGDFFKPQTAEQNAAAKNTYTNGKEYFIFIGALNPRKNLEGMLEAFRLYKQKGGSKEFMVVGTKMYWPESLKNAVNQHPYKQNIVFTGRLEREKLNQALSAASALLFVSHFEGFGIPMIEAFQCEVPVITSTKSSLPEVADGAALLCEPTDYTAIAEAMHSVEKSEVSQKLIAKGKKRAQDFSWERSADMMWESIEKCLNHG